MPYRRKLLEHTRRDIKRLKNKSSAQTWTGILLYGGTVGLLFVVPLILGAYLGHWLDTLAEGYSVRWTLSFIMLGIAVGIYNVIRFLMDKI